MPFVANSAEIVFNCMLNESMVTSFNEPGEKLLISFNPKNNKATVEHFTYYDDFEYNKKFNNIGWHKNYEKKISFTVLDLGYDKIKHYIAKIPINYDFSFASVPNDNFSLKGDALIMIAEWDEILIKNNYVMWGEFDHKEKVEDTFSIDGECELVDLKN